MIFRACTTERLVQLELRLGKRLPEDYRSFMMTQAVHPGAEGGGDVRPQVPLFYRQKFGEWPAWFDAFFYFDPPDGFSHLNIEHFGNLSTPLGCLEIACDQGGKDFGMSLEESDFGTVYHCDYEAGFPLDEAGNGYRNEEFVVARSFSEFLALIEPAGAAEIVQRQRSIENEAHMER
jgi:hypothetical protein